MTSSLQTQHPTKILIWFHGKGHPMEATINVDTNSSNTKRKGVNKSVGGVKIFGSIYRYLNHPIFISVSLVTSNWWQIISKARVKHFNDPENWLFMSKVRMWDWNQESWKKKSLPVFVCKYFTTCYRYIVIMIILRIVRKMLVTSM